MLNNKKEKKKRPTFLYFQEPVTLFTTKSLHP